MEGGWEMGAERRGFALSRRPGRVEGEPPWYLVPVEEKECANSVKRSRACF